MEEGITGDFALVKAGLHINYFLEMREKPVKKNHMINNIIPFYMTNF